MEDTLEHLKRFGFDVNALPHSLSLALGSASLTPIQIASAYSVFANGGFLIHPYLIKRIEDVSHHVLYQAPPVMQIGDATRESARSISPQNAYLITDALHDVIQSGTGRAARILKRSDLSGKTGTTNHQVDAWFSGFNTQLEATVWVGFDDLHSLHEYAARVALPIWIAFMKQALQGMPQRNMPEPPGIIRARIDPTTGLLARPNQTHARFEIFRVGEVPKESASANVDQREEKKIEANHVIWPDEQSDEGIKSDGAETNPSVNDSTAPDENASSDDSAAIDPSHLRDDGHLF